MADPRREVTIDYTNYRGERALRRIRPLRVAFENNEWHTETQWLLEAVDLDKGAERTFALANIHAWSGDATPRPAHSPAGAELDSRLVNVILQAGEFAKRDAHFLAGQLGLKGSPLEIHAIVSFRRQIWAIAAQEAFDAALAPPQVTDEMAAALNAQITEIIAAKVTTCSVHTFRFNGEAAKTVDGETTFLTTKDVSDLLRERSKAACAALTAALGKEGG